jgi:hypothetical protein
VSTARIAAALGVSKPIAFDIRAGRILPDARLWQVLAALTGVTPD